MRRILPFIAGFLLASCGMFDKEEPAPGMLRITAANLNTILLSQGAATHNITDVHVFANEQFVGTYELPAVIAILEEGPTRLNINAGIKNNGLVSHRIIYPFYAPLQLDMNLEPGVIVPLNQTETATFNYFSSNLAFFIEDFESIGTDIAAMPGSTAELLLTNEPSEICSGTGAGKAVLTQTAPYFYAATTWQMPSLPRGSNMYMEVDFRGNAPLEIGVISQTPEFSKTFAIGLNPQTQYTKVYIELTDEISQLFNTSTVRFYFEAALPPGQNEATLLLDNIKFIYPQP